MVGAPQAVQYRESIKNEMKKMANEARGIHTVKSQSGWDLGIHPKGDVGVVLAQKWHSPYVYFRSINITSVARV